MKFYLLRIKAKGGDQLIIRQILKNGSHIFKLTEVPLKQADYTWSNLRENPSFSKLDHMFVTEQWMDSFPATTLKVLLRPVSVHCPLILET